MEKEDLILKQLEEVKEELKRLSSTVNDTSAAHKVLTSEIAFLKERISKAEEGIQEMNKGLQDTNREQNDLRRDFGLYQVELKSAQNQIAELQRKMKEQEDIEKHRAGQIDGGKKVLLAVKWICAIGGGGLLMKLLERVNW